ncbi:MAG: hypothetical protein JNK76_03680 [Planctomycetales bacterium]|nr:hypothetical protein [Planctomycetales bacterium]MBN8625561.1 hypothetical protein [Planctomycetota bacterium]
MSPQPAEPSAAIVVEISVGELFDKIGILEIKRRRIQASPAAANIRREWEALTAVRDGAVGVDEAVRREFDAAVAELRQVNETLWDVEDEIRECERNRDFGDHFVQLARSVYLQNDRRAALKRRLNELVSSRIVEEKSYARYSAG